VEDNIKMDIRVIGWDGMDRLRIGLCEHGSEPLGSIKC
jgi:hypothetical protein